MEEIVPGILHWTAVHPRIGVEVSSHFVAGSGTAIDPLVPEEGIDWFDGRGLERVVLSNRHHLRHSDRLAERFGCSIHAHEAGLYEFEGGPQVTGYSFGDRIAADVAALEMDAICADDAVLRIDAGGGALLFADSVIHYGELRFVRDELIGDDPEGVKRRIRERCRALLREPFEHLLFAHGDPVIGRGREALTAFAAG